MTERCLYVVDDDDGVRCAVSFLAKAAGLTARVYDSAAAFLDDCPPDPRGCVVLDICLPGMSGLELQQVLVARGARIPIIFITGYGDVSTCATAMKAGAVDFIEKPFEPDSLLRIIVRALERDEQTRGERRVLTAFRERLARLTPRERQVMDLVIAGHSAKQIAADLQISIKTVDKHRAKVFEKMEVENAVELARAALQAERGNKG